MQNSIGFSFSLCVVVDYQTAHTLVNNARDCCKPQISKIYYFILVPAKA